MSGYTVSGRQVGLRGRFDDGTVLVETLAWARQARAYTPTGFYQKVHRHTLSCGGADWSTIAHDVAALPLLTFAADPDAPAAAPTPPRPPAPKPGAHVIADERRSRHAGARLHAHHALPVED